MYQQPSQPGQTTGLPTSGWPVAATTNPQPVTPEGWPAAPPTSAPPYAPVGPGLPAGRRRPVRVLVAAAITSLLLLGLTGNGVAVLAVRGQLRADTARLDGELAAQRRAQTQARDDLQAKFRQADLPGKLQTVRTRDEAASAALIAWGTSGQPLSGLKTVREARNACAQAVIDYDTTAARFPSDLLTGLPLRINLSDDTTDCGR